VESPSLEIFQPRLDKVLCPLLWVTLLGQGAGLGDPQRALPTPPCWGSVKRSVSPSQKASRSRLCAAARAKCPACQHPAALSDVCSPHRRQLTPSHAEKKGFPATLTCGTAPWRLSRARQQEVALVGTSYGCFKKSPRLQHVAQAPKVQIFIFNAPKLFIVFILPQEHSWMEVSPRRQGCTGAQSLQEGLCGSSDPFHRFSVLFLIKSQGETTW